MPLLDIVQIAPDTWGWMRGLHQACCSSPQGALPTRAPHAPLADLFSAIRISAG